MQDAEREEGLRPTGCIHTHASRVAEMGDYVITGEVEVITDVRRTQEFNSTEGRETTFVVGIHSR